MVLPAEARTNLPSTNLCEGGEIMEIETATLLGVILIGMGLALQGWFILDLNKRITTLMSRIWVEKMGQETTGLTGLTGNIGLTGITGENDE